MIQFTRNGKFRRLSVTISRYVDNVDTPGNGFPITESLLQKFGNYPALTEQYLVSMTDVAFDQRVEAFKVWLAAKYNFLSINDFQNSYSGVDEVLCVPENIAGQAELVITSNTNLLIYFDATGSMGTTYTALDDMRRTVFKDKLLPFYNNDQALYDSKVRLIDFQTERAFQAMNHMNKVLEGNTVVMVFQNEAVPIYHTAPFNSVPKTDMVNDLVLLKQRITNSRPNKYKVLSFHLHGPGGWRTSSDAYKAMMKAVELGNSGFEAETANLTNYPEVKFLYDLDHSQTPQYYLNEIIQAMNNLGYAI
jgi:hypothetical protein